jgi:hypothetical protein
VMFELDLEPLSREQALRGMWGGFSGQRQL